MTEHEHKQTSFEYRFFNQCRFIKSRRSTMPDLVGRIMTNYCTREGSDCARRRVNEKLGPGIVPELMLPDQFEWAEQFIGEYVSGIKSS